MNGSRTPWQSSDEFRFVDLRAARTSGLRGLVGRLVLYRDDVAENGLRLM